MRESLDDLGFRHAEEEAWPAARAARRRRLDLGRRRRQQVAAPAARVYGERIKCPRREPCPSLYGWRGRPAKGREWSPSPTRLGWCAGLGRRDSLPNSVSTSSSSFRKLPFDFQTSRLTFQFRI